MSSKIWIKNKMFLIDEEVAEHIDILEFENRIFRETIDKCLVTMDGSNCLEEKILKESLELRVNKKAGE